MSPPNLTPEQAEFRQSLVCIVFAVLALAGCGWLVWVSVENLRSGSWPRAQGTLESFQIMQEVKTRGGNQYLAETRYSFTVDGKGYHGDRFNTRGNYLAGEQEAATLKGKYHAGGSCSVAYDPSDPSQCFLDTSVTWHTWGKMVIGVVLGLVGLLFLYFGLKGVFRKGPAESAPPA
jgi:hypothetical protein